MTENTTKSTLKSPLSKQAYWFKLIAAWETSGKQQQAYCTAQGVKHATFQYWRTKYLRKETKIPPSKMTFKPVKLKQSLPQADNHLQGKLLIRTSDGLTCHISESISPSLLSTIVTLLRARYD